MFPHLFPLARNPKATLGDFWEDTFNLTLDSTLSDQRVAEFMSMWQSLMHKRPQSETYDGWEWEDATFSVQESYVKIRNGHYEEDKSITPACRFTWRQKVLLKVQIFRRILLRRRPMACVFRKGLHLDTMAICMMFSRSDEDGTHLFSECPFAKTI